MKKLILPANKKDFVKAILKWEPILMPLATLFVISLIASIIDNTDLSGYQKKVLLLVEQVLIYLILFALFLVKVIKNKNSLNLRIKSEDEYVAEALVAKPDEDVLTKSFNAIYLLIFATLIGLIYTHLDNPLTKQIMSMSKEHTFTGFDEISGYLRALFLPSIMFYFISLFFKKDIEQFRSAIIKLLLIYIVGTLFLLIAFL